MFWTLLSLFFLTLAVEFSSNTHTHTYTSGGSSHEFRSELIKAELAFNVTWLLDNVFPCDGREYTVQRKELTGVNVMLDHKDATKVWT